MQKSFKTKLSKVYLSNFSINSVISLVFLVCGVVAGLIISKCSDCGEFLSSFENKIQLIATNGVGEYSLWSTFFNSIKFPLLVFFFGFTAFGVVLTPAAVFVKGCFVSASVSAAVSSFGTKGILFAVSIFGIQTLVSIPCLIAVSSFSIELSKAFLFAFKRSKRSSVEVRPQISSFVVLFLFMLLVLFLFSALDVVLTPKLVSISAKTIF